MFEYYRRQMAVYHEFREDDKTGARASLWFDAAVTKDLRVILQKAWRASKGDETLRARIAPEVCAFLALPLMGCPRDKVEQYGRDLSLMTNLIARYNIALCEVNMKDPTPERVARCNRNRIARWEKIHAKASTANPLPLYCRDSITLTEKSPWFQCKRVKDTGALTPDPVRHPHAPGWLMHWNFDELVATAPNQTFYVARARMMGDFHAAHKPTDELMVFAISRAGDDAEPPGMKIRFCDLPEKGAWGFVNLARVHLYTVSPRGYFYSADIGLEDDEAILFDYLEFIPEADFKDKEALKQLPTLVL